jgi:hypothetical protein
MPYIIDNITANTINVKDTLLIKGQSIENVIATESYDVKPTSTKLTRIPNNYIGWKNKFGNPFWQSVEISSTTEQVIVNLIAAELGIFGFASPGAFINVGDTITISGASVAGNNGVWEIIQVSYDYIGGGASTVTVKQTVDRKLTEEIIIDPSNITCTYQKRTIVELSWIHAQLEDGTQIWEAYDNNNWDGEDIYGYWVVIKPNYETGETTVLSTLKMSENFWDYSYNYTVKVEGEPNSVILTTLISGTGSENNVDSVNFKLTVTNGVLSLEETIYDLGISWETLFFNLTGVNTNKMEFKNPWYNSDNDYYGMMFGPEMGWVWMYLIPEQPYFVGYNMLTGETQLIDVSESFVNIKNINYMGDETPEGTLSNALKLINTVISNPKYGLLLQLNSDGIVGPSPTALWSPNYTNVEYVTLLDMVDNNDNLINTNGSIFSIRWTITNNYFITADFYQTNQGVSFTRIKLDSVNEESEYETITSVFNSTLYENFLYIWERENSCMVSYPLTGFGGSLANDNFFVWRNDKQYPEFIKTPNMYPNMVEDGKLTGWDNSWTRGEIITMTNNFKNNTF